MKSSEMAQKTKTLDQKRLDKLEANVTKLIQQNMLLNKQVTLLMREKRRLVSKVNQHEAKIKQISSQLLNKF